MPAVVQHLAGLVDRFDVASAGEMRVALDTPMPSDARQLRRPRQDRRPSSRQAVAAGVTIEMESATEAERVVAIGDAARASGRGWRCA